MVFRAHGTVRLAVKKRGQILHINQILTGRHILIWYAGFQHKNLRVFGIPWGRGLIPSTVEMASLLSLYRNRQK